MAKKKEAPLPVKASREEMIAFRVAARIRESDQLALAYLATLDPRQRETLDPA